MGKLRDITGLSFGKLTVIKRAGTSKQGEALWLCKCECGNTTITKGSFLRNGTTKSCGCLQFLQRQKMGRANKYRYKDLSGKRFGRWLVVQRADNAKGGVTYECICDCGTKKNVLARSLLGGVSQSCGCLKAEKTAEQSRTHGLSKHPLYHVMVDMMDRCYNPRAQEYKNYGKRGITICDEWRNDYGSFVRWGLEHGYAKGLQIDRIDNSKGYSPSNCRFVTPSVNANNRRNTVMIEVRGQVLPCAEAARIYNISPETIRRRYRAGMRGEKLIYKGKLERSHKNG